MPDGAAEGQPRKTKLEKISELEASLKLAKETIHLHKKEIDRLKKAGRSEASKSEPSSSSKPYSQDDQEKLKLVLKAMKRVTVKQEMNLQTMKESASDRRRTIKEKDETIASLKQRLRSMDKTIRSMEQANSKNNHINNADSAQARIRKLEKKCYDEENKNMELRQKLERAEARIKQLVERKGDDSVGQREAATSSHFHNSNQSIGSAVSEAEVAKMRQELARKSTKICNLEYELEVAKDELVGLKEQAQGHNSFTGHDSMQASFTIGEDGFPTAPPIGADPFKAAADPFGSAAMLGNSSLFSDSESEEEESDFDD